MQNAQHRGESEFIFPVGYQRFHRRQLFNFPLNRWYSQGYARREDMAEVGEPSTTKAQQQPNNSIERAALRAAADADRQAPSNNHHL